jgi:hypothetical protein
MGEGFRDLEVWREAKALAIDMHRETDSVPIYRFVTNCDARQSAFLPTSLKSTSATPIRIRCDSSTSPKARAAELRSQIDLASRVGLIATSDSADVDERREEVAKMLRKLIKARQPHARTPHL